MQQRMTEPDSQQPSEDRAQRNRKVLFTLMLLCTVMLFLVSALPTVLIPPALSQLFAYGCLGASIVAALRGERVFADHLTLWDQAAALMALSLLAGVFTDPASVGTFPESYTPELPPEVPAGGGELPGAPQVG